MMGGARRRSSKRYVYLIQSTILVAYEFVTGNQITLLYYMIKLSTESPHWTPAMLVKGFAGIWFAGAHQPWIVGLIFKLCLLY